MVISLAPRGWLPACFPARPRRTRGACAAGSATTSRDCPRVHFVCRGAGPDIGECPAPAAPRLLGDGLFCRTAPPHPWRGWEGARAGVKAP